MEPEARSTTMVLRNIGKEVVMLTVQRKNSGNGLNTALLLRMLCGLMVGDGVKSDTAPVQCNFPNYPAELPLNLVVFDKSKPITGGLPKVTVFEFLLDDVEDAKTYALIDRNLGSDFKNREAVLGHVRTTGRCYLWCTWRVSKQSSEHSLTKSVVQGADRNFNGKWRRVPRKSNLKETLWCIPPYTTAFDDGGNG